MLPALGIHVCLLTWRDHYPFSFQTGGKTASKVRGVSSKSCFDHGL